MIQHPSEADPIGRVLQPYVTGGAVIGLKCKEGVLIATDTLLSYGGLLSTSNAMLEYQGVNRF